MVSIGSQERKVSCRLDRSHGSFALFAQQHAQFQFTWTLTIIHRSMCPVEEINGNQPAKFQISDHRSVSPPTLPLRADHLARVIVFGLPWPTNTVAGDWHMMMLLWAEKG